MSIAPPITGNLSEDWKQLSDFWAGPGRVLGAEVGPTWQMPREHLACILFAEAYPDSKGFLLEKLSDPSPIVAAYAFKCLVRVADLKPDDIPPSARSRGDLIETVFHSSLTQQTLGGYIAEYFEQFSSREELLESQKQSLDWQKHELAAYKKAKDQEKGQS